MQAKLAEAVHNLLGRLAEIASHRPDAGQQSAPDADCNRLSTPSSWSYAVASATLPSAGSSATGRGP